MVVERATVRVPLDLMPASAEWSPRSVEARFLELEAATTTRSLQREFEPAMADRDLGRRNLG